MMNKKGLASGIIIITIVLFIFALSSLFSLKMWSEFNNTIQDMDNETIAPHVKEQINNLGERFDWGDKLFTIVMIMLLATFMITSATIPVNEPIFIIFYAFILVGVTISAMIISNSWTYLLNSSTFIGLQAQLTFTNHFMRYYPIIVFIIGVIGGLLFYGRREGLIGINGGNSGGSIDGFE